MRECWMIKAEIRKMGDLFPLALVIAIASTEVEAHNLAEKELKPYFTGYPYRIGFENMGPIIFSPIPTTVFLYTQSEGWIKQNPIKEG